MARKTFRQKYEEHKGIEKKEFYPTLQKDLEGVKSIYDAPARIQSVSEENLKVGVQTLRKVLKGGYRGGKFGIDKNSDAWAIGHVPVGRPKKD